MYSSGDTTHGEIFRINGQTAGEFLRLSFSGTDDLFYDIDVASANVPDVLNVNAWNHVAHTYDGSKYQVFVNGVEVVSQSADLRPVYANDGFLVRSGTREAPVAIDEVRFWDVARSQSDIQQGILEPLNGDEGGLAAYWKFEGNLKDSSVHQHPDATGFDVAFFENPAPQIGHIDVLLTQEVTDQLGLWVTYEISGTAALPGVDFFSSAFRRVSSEPATEQTGIIINKGENSGRIYFYARPDAIKEFVESFIITLSDFSFDGGVEVFVSQDTPKAIADFGTTNSFINVNNSTPISDVDVNLHIAHPLDRDLDVFLNGPDASPAADV